MQCTAEAHIDAHYLKGRDIMPSSSVDHEHCELLRRILADGEPSGLNQALVLLRLMLFVSRFRKRLPHHL